MLAAHLAMVHSLLSAPLNLGLLDPVECAQAAEAAYRSGDAPPGIRMVPTGRTIAQEWDAADNARRREMLAEFEVRVALHPTRHDPRMAITGMEIITDGSAC